MRKRRTEHTIVEIAASCDGCDWSSDAKNALANAARHHDAKGHTVVVRRVMRTVYGIPNAPIPGQTSLDDQEVVSMARNAVERSGSPLLAEESRFGQGVER